MNARRSHAGRPARSRSGATSAVTTRDARFQQWLALLTNRTKREHSGQLLVQGVRPISLAVQHGWPIATLLYDPSRPLSTWASNILEGAPAGARVAVAPPLLQELSDKEEGVPELLAILRRPPDSFERILLDDLFLGVLFDRPTSPGNIGALVRSADAFGATAVVVSGHAADPYDPKAIRASTGSTFAVPIVRAPSHNEVLAWARPAASLRPPVQIVGLDERGAVDAHEHDFTRPTLLLLGNEKTGLSTAWRAACDRLVRIPMAAGSASSLNAATAAAVVLYEAFMQRSRKGVVESATVGPRL
jgi:tRNA G18 (ribose-2'-O)-methylase SpoU